MQIENGEVEEAITTFVKGVDHGYFKCAYGIIHTVMNHRLYTMTDDEAISIFSSAYSDIKLLAQEGDTEAMVMVAEGIRLGFVEDDDESYLFWLTKAAECGDKSAIDILKELDLPYNSWDLTGGLSFVTNEALEGMDSTDKLLLDDQLNLEDVEDIEDIEGILDERVLTDDADWVIREQFDINYLLKKTALRFEQLKCEGDVNAEVSILDTD